MKIGYAVLGADEDINTSEKIGFVKVIQLDRMFVDYGEDREEQKKMLQLIQPGNVVIFQSPEDCGMDYEEQIRLRQHIIRKTSDVMYFSGENIPDISSVINGDETEDDNESDLSADEYIPKKRGRKSKKLDQDEFNRLVYLMNKKKLTKKEVCKRLGITYPTLISKLKEAQEIN